MISAVQVWSPDDWENFALGLLQTRHGALRVNKIPAAHKGDLGVDFYCIEQAVAYQCYAVQEPVDILTRADRQKKKITTDLNKIVSKPDEIAKLFLGKPVKHWVLLTPLHDTKDLNLHCSKKTLEVRAAKCKHLDDSFEVTIHDQTSFPGSAVTAGMASLATVQLSIPEPTNEEMRQWSVGSPNLLANATHKLAKRAGSADVQESVADIVRSFLQGNALLDALRFGAPDLHEKVTAGLAARARRLKLAGPEGWPTAGAILRTELDNLVVAVKTAAPALSDANAEQIAFGTISEWIFRCPLDFP